MTLRNFDQLLSLVAACGCKTGGYMTLRKLPSRGGMRLRTGNR